MEKNNMTAVELLEKKLKTYLSWSSFLEEDFQEAKQMENEQHDNWNKFLETEKTLGISDVKTIERIQWYYNQYFNQTYGK